ncbi:chemotaxis protein [Aliarcobacter trophiarum LMG 25534]|uniref:Chemotaxis protein n=1 Tax=Aliarcobacter trophiarum LMG 25534 TaxID=1032241 RepID=A0AAD0VM78_9BACT|nr:methyl-accepting chemotaxis protein [Aliarcobacter trophiarum]AXK49173.1 NIT sensor-containing MCP-domain signal transduction protein [Aliarcobacter trophiarum LMG 25534]RXI25498.1 chemotaxis protein [Aliarcobacter trophiarum]RXJ89804.1 chemotaxis protein [Aliarcobacter trophiarum LMG 25534]
MISSLSIKQKLILIMLIPLLIVILLAAKLAFDSYASLENLKKLDKVVVLSTKVGALVHETQKERGMTAGFIGSRGAKFKDELPKQRDEVNKQLANLNIYLKDFDKNLYSADFIKNLDDGLTKLKDLEEIRAKVNAFDIPAPKAIAYYTDTNTLLLNILGNIVKQSNSSNITKELASYMNFLLSKERTGIERAVGTNTFAQDKFTPELKAKFYNLVAEQIAYLDIFSKIASQNIKDFYSKTVVGKAIDEVERMRTVALFSNIDEKFGIDPNYWFSTITDKIELLKEVEDFVANSLLNQIESEKSEANFHLLIFSLLSVFGVAITMILARTIAFTILIDVGSVRAGVEEFFAFINFEKEDIKLIDVNSKDELGNMARIINKNIENTKANIQKDRALIADTIRVANSINKGYLNQEIEASSNNPALNDLKNIINEMLNTLNSNISNILNVLTSYSKLDFRPKLKDNELEGIIKELENDINILRDVITKTLLDNKKIGLTLQDNANILSQNMKHISNSANTQAASLEETAASLEEITSNITNNTQTTAKMSDYGQRVKTSIAIGQDLANKTVKSMDDINSEALAISEAITVIDQIAFQTNILSLNAAVEAATAGEAGKGFAVVAGEVRNLANRSAEAAKRIQELVENAQDKAKDGKQIATEMIEGYAELNENISTTIDLIQNVTTASKEQNSGMVQINSAVNSLDQITQKNAQNANIANDIAQKTLEISKEILDQVNQKTFEGK